MKKEQTLPKEPKLQKITLRAFKFENQDIKKSKNNVFDKIKTVLKENFSVSTRKMYLNQDDPKKENDSLSYYDFMNNYEHLVGTLLRSSEEDTQPKIDESFFEKPRFAINELKNSIVETGIVYKEHYYIAISKNFLVTNLRTSFKRIQTYINYLTNSTCCNLTPVLEDKKAISFENIKKIALNDCPLNIQNEDNSVEKFNKSILLNPKEIINFIKDRIFYNNGIGSLTDKDLVEMVSVQLILGFQKPKNMTKDQHMKRMAELTLKYVDDPSDVEVRGSNNKKLTGNKLLKEKAVLIEKTDQNDIIEQDLYQEMVTFLIELENE